MPDSGSSFDGDASSEGADEGSLEGTISWVLIRTFLVGSLSADA
jgi:hypothetical protein